MLTCRVVCARIQRRDVRSDLKRAKVLQQIDCKFIACRIHRAESAVCATWWKRREGAVAQPNGVAMTG